MSDQELELIAVDPEILPGQAHFRGTWVPVSLARAGCSGVVYRLAGNVDTDTHLSETVNKYIGEIEKNLVRVFDGVQHRGSVLLFGEADDLFGRRADGDGDRDRYIRD